MVQDPSEHEPEDRTKRVSATVQWRPQDDQTRIGGLLGASGAWQANRQGSLPDRTPPDSAPAVAAPTFYASALARASVLSRRAMAAIVTPGATLKAWKPPG